MKIQFETFTKRLHYQTNNQEIVDDQHYKMLENFFLSKEQINSLRKAQSKVQTIGLAEVGKVYFKHLFIIAPYLHSLFPFRDEVDIFSSKTMELLASKKMMLL